MNSCRQLKLYSFRMEANTPEQLLTDIGHNFPLVFHLPGGKRSAEKSISWTSLVHILAPPIVSAVIPTPKYPNWRAHSFGRGNSSLTQHPCISLPFYLLTVYKIWRYSEKKQDPSRGFSAVYDCNELPKLRKILFLLWKKQRWNIPMCLWFFFSLRCFFTYVSSVYWGFLSTNSKQ